MGSRVGVGVEVGFKRGFGVLAQVGYHNLFAPSGRDDLPDVPNLGMLAKNAMDGMALLDAITAKEKSKTMTKEEATSRRFWVKVVLDRVEPDYSTAVNAAVSEDLQEGSN